jgi:hypothetical protein
MRLYHFTSEHNLAGIQAEGVLRVTGPNLFPPGRVWRDRETGEAFTGTPPRGQLVVWLLNTETVEGDNGIAPDNRDCRVTVEVQDAHPWLAWLTAQPREDWWVRAVIDSGGGIGCARHWYVVARPIPRAE